MTAVFTLHPFSPHSSLSSVAKMSLENKSNALGGEKYANDVPANDIPAYEQATLRKHSRGRQFSIDPEDRAMVEADQHMLKRNLKGRHMQMIAM